MTSPQPGGPKVPVTLSEAASPTSAAPVVADLLDSREAGSVALRGSITRSAAYVLGILLSLASVRVLITHLGVAEFGRYVTALSLVTIVAGLTEGGLNGIVLRESALLRGDSRRDLMRSAIGVRLLMTGVGVALMVGFAAGVGYGTDLVVGIALAGAGLILQLVQSTLSMTLQADLRFGWMSAAELVRQIVNVGLLVTLALAGAGLVPLLAVAIPASAMSLAFTLPLVVGRVSVRPSLHAARLWRLLRETIPWAVVVAINVVYFRVSIVLMSLIARPVQTGYFATSFRITEVLAGIPGLLIGAAFPILARAQRDDEVRFGLATARIFELALLAGTWLVLCLEVAAGFAIHVIAAHKAEPAIAVLRIQGLALLATFVSVASGYPLLTLRRYREVLAANLLALASAAVLTVALAPSLGAQGAAVGALVGEAGLAIGQVALLRRTAPTTILSPGVIGVVVVAGGLAAVAGFTLPVHPLLAVTVASGVYFAVLKLLGHFPPEVREVAGHFWPPAGHRATG